MGDHDQDGPVEPARPPLTATQAQQMTAGLRGALEEVQRSVAVLAARVRDAHTARVWTPLGYPSWAAYCAAEFGISRAQAYRLLDTSRSLAAIHNAVTGVSRARDTHTAGLAALDYGLSQRALVAVSRRTDTLAALITRRLTTLAHSGLDPFDEPAVRALVRQAVRDIRTTPPPTDPPATPAGDDPAVAELRRIAEDLVACSQRFGELLLEVAPAYLSDTEAAGILAPLCAAVGEDLRHGLAARRYALCGDRRALHGTVL